MEEIPAADIDPDDSEHFQRALKRKYGKKLSPIWA
jgi:hypothetical protein